MTSEFLHINGSMAKHTIVPIIGDGACLFRTLSFLMYGTQERAMEVRTKIVRHVVSNWQEFKIMSHDSNGDNYSSASTYSADMSHQSTWGTTCELMAAGQIFEFMFEVYQNTKFYAKFGVNGRPIKRLRFTGNHFDAYLLEDLHSPEIVSNSKPDNFFSSTVVPKKITKRRLKVTTSEGCFQPQKPASVASTLSSHFDSQMIKENYKISPTFTEPTSVCGLISPTFTIQLTPSSPHSVLSQLFDIDTDLSSTFTTQASKEVPQSLKKKIKNRVRFTGLTKKKQHKKSARRNPSARREAIAMSRYINNSHSDLPFVINTETSPTFTSQECKEVSEFQKNKTKNRVRFTDFTRKKQIKDSATRNPSTHCNAVARYTNNYPQVHRKAVSKYQFDNPEVHRHSKSISQSKNSEQHRVTQSQYELSNSSQRQQRRLRHWKTKALSGMAYDPEIEYESDSTTAIGAMSHKCKWCNALKWKEESVGMCCNAGKVQLQSFERLPEPLYSLIMDFHPKHDHFMKRVRMYNNAFQMTSFGGKQVTSSGFMPTFKVQGQVYHLIGSLLPTSQDVPKFLQIYFVGEDDREANIRCLNFPGIEPGLVKQLQKMLHEVNPYIKDFKTALEKVPNSVKDFQVVIHAEKKPSNEHSGRFNAPSAKEVALVMAGEQFEYRDIILESRGQELRRIYEIHRSYDALQYPLMFCRGEDGYTIYLPQRDPKTKIPISKNVSAASFYAYRLMLREEEENHLFYFRSLFSQFLVDEYAKIETERLNFIRNSQSKLRTDEYIHLRDAVSRQDADNLGQMVVLPSSFTGGPRYMHERTQDAMTYVRHYGRPDLFITFTCNPNWKGIKTNLLPGQQPHDRQDLIARVFRLKIKNLMHLLIKGKIFGEIRCYMYSVEWQKRGLPHIHILLWLKHRLSSDRIDTVIRAEIPDPQSDEKLYNIVKSHMIHGPCGSFNYNSPCMKSNKCSKKYPKPLLHETETGEDGYPQYRRRSPDDGGCTVKIKEIDVNNGWVVPYNPVLLRTFNAHINVEYCSSVKSIKYVCKYINKGTDQATFVLENAKDEVKIYESGRYISSSEGAWRILGFPIHERFPTVFHLAVHLENGQRVYFNQHNLAEIISNPPVTTLLAFFKLCQIDNFAKTLLYVDIPAYYVWQKNKMFQRRKIGVDVDGWPGVKKENALGRVYTVHPNNTECYHLRMLLQEVRGPTSFEALKTVNGVLHRTFQSACKSLGLLEDDQNWYTTLEEAALCRSPFRMRELFTTMLVFCQISDPLCLWEKFKDQLTEDFKRQIERQSDGILIGQLTDEVYNCGLSCIEEAVLELGGRALKEYGLPEPRKRQLVGNREYLREINYNVQALEKLVAENEVTLTAEQKSAYDVIMSSVEFNAGKLFFLDAAGGTGKTYLLNLILAKIRSSRGIAVAVASSGIAATLLEGGRTAHAAFKLPLRITGSDTTSCNISKGSNIAEVLKNTKLIVWDEITMAHKECVQALSTTLKDIRGNSNTMGGITVLLAGDFRQTLPVVPRGTRADEIKACLKNSVLWPSVERLKYETRNMRVNNDILSAGRFSDILLQIGNGVYPSVDSRINIPDELATVIYTIQELIDHIYPDITHILDKPIDWFCERAILTPKNDQAAHINDVLLKSFHGDEMVYDSIDSVCNKDDAVNYPVEFLNSLKPAGLPYHRLILKKGTPVMLLRNLSPPKLCNGTRLQIVSLHTNLVEAIILTGCAQGETVLVPRIPLIPSDLPYDFKRLQFPLQVCFAMTINKAQGQTLKYAGVDLRHDCFSHGQFYVACSRVSSPKNLIILASLDKKVKNVVYSEIL